MSSEVKKIKPPSLAYLQAARAPPRQTDTHLRATFWAGWAAPAPGQWPDRALGEMHAHKARGSRTLGSRCLKLLPHSSIISTCLSPGRPSSSASSPWALLTPQKASPRPSLHHFAVKGSCYTMPYLSMPFIPSAWPWDLLNFWSRLHFSLLMGSLSAELLPCPHLLYLDYSSPSFLPYTCL